MASALFCVCSFLLDAMRCIKMHELLFAISNRADCSQRPQMHTWQCTDPLRLNVIVYEWESKISSGSIWLETRSADLNGGINEN